MTTAENYDAVASGRSAIRQWKDHRGVPGTFVASLFPDGTFPDGGSDGLSPLEAMAVASARRKPLPMPALPAPTAGRYSC